MTRYRSNSNDLWEKVAGLPSAEGQREEMAGPALPIRVRHPATSVVKPFGWFGGVGYGEGLDWRLVDDRRGCGAGWGLGAGGNGAGAYDCGEDGGGAEAGWLFQPLLGCEAGEAVAGD